MGTGAHTAPVPAALGQWGAQRRDALPEGYGDGDTIISPLPCPKAMPRSASRRVKLWIRWHFKAIYILSWQCEFTRSQQTVVKTQTWHRLFSQIQSCPSKTYLVTLFSQSAMDFLFDSTKPKNEGLVPWKDDVSHHTSDFRSLWTRKGSRIWNAITDRKAILVNFFWQHPSTQHF